MTLLLKYPYIFAIIPFAIVIVIAYFLDAFPKSSVLKKFLDLIAEKDLGKLMIKAGLTKTSVVSYQILRVGLAFMVILILSVFGGIGKDDIILAVGIWLAMYKLLYVFLLIKERNRINKLNQELPYCIKAVSYLCYLYPVNNAFEKSIDYVPEVFKYDIETLVKDIDEDPLTFAPYKKWIDRYEGKLTLLDGCLRNLYRMSSSTSKEQDKHLANLNSSLSAETRRVRKAKNDSINSTITWLGMIPVLLLATMLIVLIVVVVGAL